MKDTMKNTTKTTFKSHVGNATDVLPRIEPRADDLSGRAGDAQALLTDWGSRARRFTRNNPGTVLIGAVALGFLLARAARHG
jgi:hypothetical protein